MRWMVHGMDELRLCEEVTTRLQDALKKVDLPLWYTLLQEDIILVGTLGVHGVVGIEVQHIVIDVVRHDA